MEKYIADIEASEKIDPVTKLIALSEIDRIKKAEINCLYEYSDHLDCAFMWHATENGWEFWNQIYELLQ